MPLRGILISGKKGVIDLSEFCTCGSIIIAGSCTNKNCSLKAAKKGTASVEKLQKKEKKTTRTKRASKCITYNLYEAEEHEEAE